MNLEKELDIDSEEESWEDGGTGRCKTAKEPSQVASSSFHAQPGFTASEMTRRRERGGNWEGEGEGECEDKEARNDARGDQRNLTRCNLLP